ncbi:MAG: magnesium transporter [Chloroflexi bacterium HGW-Chloroflexi-10]|nr:MAG: magnesium transporter [Chloroflexi bacterium HGW-Chloroflexi-10]
MLKIFTTKGNNTLVEIDEFQEKCWVHVVDPSVEDTKQLHNIGVPPDFITYSLDEDERPRMEKEDDGTILFLLRTPFFQGDEFDIPYITIVLGIIFKDNIIITISKRENELLNPFLQSKVRGFSTNKKNRFVLFILLKTAKKYLELLNQIDARVELVEDRLQKSLNNKEVLELLKFQKSLVYFETGLRTNEVMMEKLDRTRIFLEYEEDEDLLDDVITENKQAREMVMISSTILSSMMDAFASIISNNLNDVMKILTSVTIVLSLPTLVTGFFGMNVMIPFAEGANSVWLILMICAILIVAAFLVFLWRKWI